MERNSKKLTNKEIKSLFKEYVCILLLITQTLFLVIS